MVITRSPLRVSFFGGGTDYPGHYQRHGGAVLGAALDKFTFVTASPFFSSLFDYSVRLSYRKVELVRRIDEVEHNVYRECLRLCGIERDIELHAMADLPAFTGLGSSSSFTVSLLLALHAFRGEFIAPLDLAREAIQVEREILKEPVGSQDQVFAAFGGFNLIEFWQNEEIVVHRLPLRPARIEELEQHLIMVFTGVTRRAVDVTMPQLSRVEANRETLLAMRRMVDRGAAILTGSGSLAAFGDLLHDAWMAKRSLHGDVSSGAIDELYERGRAHGALGGKLLGAGGGGFMLFCAPPESLGALMRAFGGFQIFPVRLGLPGAQIVFA
jgi:D-glycero-alpha-D-manno-heptose-7-phosphate kinase